MKKSFFNYLHHGKLVWANTELVGKHREHCLCWVCKKFKPGEDNCKVAQELFEVCRKHNLVTPVWECPNFRELLPDFQWVSVDYSPEVGIEYLSIADFLENWDMECLYNIKEDKFCVGCISNDETWLSKSFGTLRELDTWLKRNHNNLNEYTENAGID